MPQPDKEDHAGASTSRARTRSGNCVRDDLLGGVVHDAGGIVPVAGTGGVGLARAAFSQEWQHVIQAENDAFAQVHRVAAPPKRERQAEG